MDIALGDPDFLQHSSWRGRERGGGLEGGGGRNNEASMPFSWSSELWDDKPTEEWYRELDGDVPWERSSQVSDLRRFNLGKRDLITCRKRPDSVE